jgi:hypothetical protein
MPGYGFSGKPTSTGWGPERIARAWDVLMKRLGYSRYVAQGGDWGAAVVDQIRADTSPPGSSRSSCPRKCARASSRCGRRRSVVRKPADSVCGLFLQAAARVDEA